MTTAIHPLKAEHWDKQAIAQSERHEEPETIEEILDDTLDRIGHLIGEGKLSRDDFKFATLRALDIQEADGSSVGPDFRLALAKNLDAGRRFIAES